MKIVVIGGTGLIGRGLVAALAGHEVVAASPSTGVNTLTGEGVMEALRGAQVVVDVSNSPSFEAESVRSFFETSTGNLLSASQETGVGHYVALSIVGLEAASNIDYMKAKILQERLIKAAGLPYTIVRATQFQEFVGAIGQTSVVDGEIVLPDAELQPIAAADVSAYLARVATGPPLNGTVDIAGPERGSFADFVRRHAAVSGESRPVRVSADGRYFGAPLAKSALVPAGEAWLGEKRFAEFLAACS